MTVLMNSLAVVVGLLLGSTLNVAIISVGPILIPPPNGVDMSDMDRVAENMKLLRPRHFVAPWLAHALGTLVGGAVAAKLAASQPMFMAMVVAGCFLLGGIAMVMMIGGPVWFIALDLVAAYLPMGYLGGRFVESRRRSSI